MRIIIKNKSRGSALILVLVLITIITIICTLILSGILLQLRFIRRQLYEIQARYLAEAGVFKTIWYLGGNEGKDMTWRPHREKISLFDGFTSDVTAEPWGGYFRVLSKVDFRRITKKIDVLLGQKVPQPFKQAIHIGNERYPLVVTGDNRIIGDVIVGLKGVETGSIQGRKFTGDRPVEGKIFRIQNPRMPFFNNMLFREAVNKYRHILQFMSDDKIIDPEKITEDYLNSDSTAKKIRILDDLDLNNLGISKMVQGPLRISCSGNITIGGNTKMVKYIELVAKGKIFIRDQVALQNCVVYADSGIEVSGQSQIEGQLISPGDIIIKDRTVLEYPSIVYCYGRLINNVLYGTIHLADQAVVKGTMILYSEARQFSGYIDETSIQIDQDSRMVGAIYSNHYTMLQGTVIGSVATGTFTLYVSPTSYINWLMDATIDRTRLPETFLMALFFDEKPILDILCWEEIH